MGLVKFYKFNILKKDEEERRGQESYVVPTSYELIDIRDDPLVLLDLFHPWEFKIVVQEKNGGLYDKLTIEAQFVPKYLALDWGAQYNERQVQLLVKDLDTKSCYHMYCRKWIDDGRFTVFNNWYLNFVQRRKLREGDTIGLYWDRHSSSTPTLCISVVERAGSE